MAGGCDSVTRLLSPYVDDELSGSDRAAVAAHLSGCKDCQARLADLEATHAAMSAYFTAKADAADFSGFTARVMGQIQSEPLSFGQRARLWWAETMAYHSTAIYSSFGAATAAACAVLLFVGVPVGNRGDGPQPPGETVIHSLEVQDPGYEPVVMHTEDGETITMLVEHEDGPDDLPAAEAPHGGNL